MRTSLDCIPCFVQQGLSALRQVCDDDAEIDRVLKLVLTEIAAFDTALSPPEMGRAIHAVVRREIGHPDPYQKIKQRSTREALSVMPEVRQRIDQSDHPFRTAVRYAIAGNILDYALVSLWEPGPLDRMLARAESKALDEEAVDRLEQAVDSARTILWLADNAGETVFDRLMIERITGKRIVYAVKGSPVINDATLQDALEAGLGDVAEVVSTGSDAPGTVLHLCSPPFREIFDHAEVVIAKGQANFETLNEADREVYLLTQIKCAIIAQHYDRQVGDWLVTTPAMLAEYLTMPPGDQR